MDKKADRHLELSAKFIEMGNALMAEGKESQDYTVTQTGSFMILMGSLMFDEKDVYLFGQMCSMFSSKQILENIQKDDVSYEELINKIKNLRKKY